jgi:hypothetical protein
MVIMHIRLHKGFTKLNRPVRNTLQSLSGLSEKIEGRSRIRWFYLQKHEEKTLIVGAGGGIRARDFWTQGNWPPLFSRL